MNILITGAKGMLATQIVKDIKRGRTEIGAVKDELRKAKLFMTDMDELDITDKDLCNKYIIEKDIDVVINCAAYTNVDGCETNEKDAYNVNAIGPRNLAIACEFKGAKLIHISTDYVFSGTGNTPIHEYELPAPTSVYGKTKLAGEEYVKQFSSKHMIVRISWLYGYYGKNFVKTMITAGKKHGALKVVNDQVGNPTNAADVSHHILNLVISNEYGMYHCTGKGECSWYDFAKEIIRLSGVKATVSPCSSDEYPTPTKRPEYSSLENMMLKITNNYEMRHWKDALKSYFENMPEDIKGELL